MSYERGIISTYTSGVDLVFEWKIENFFNLPERDGTYYNSPVFSFGGEKWNLWIHPNGSSRNDSSGHVDLNLWKCSPDPIKQSFSLSLKTAKGEKYNEQNVTKDFEKVWDYHKFNRFIQRSDLTRRRYELVPDGVLTVVCAMKSSTSAGSVSNTASTSDKCCHCKITFNAQNLSSHQKRCMHRPIKCPDCLEVVVLQKWLDEHECQKERSEDYNCREKLLMFLCIASILIAVVTGCILAYSKTPLSSTHPCGDLVMSNEQLQEKIAQLEAVAETLKARESELNAIKKEHGELQRFYESIASKKNKLEQNLVQLKKEMEEKQSKIDSITKELRKKETDFNDFKNKNEKLIRKLKEIESEKKSLEEKATENKNHNSSKDHGKELAATIIIFIIAIACVYVYSKTSLSVQHPYGEGTQTISAEDYNIVKADLSEVAETGESEASDSKTCATETEGPSEACASGCSANPHQNKLHYDLKELFLKKEDYDVTIKVEGSEFPALRAILKARSPVFASTFRHNMKENATGILEIEDCDPSTFSDFLCFLYCGDVGIISQKNVFGLSTAADKYQVLDLRAKCLEFIKKNLTVDTFCETITLALQHSETELIKLSTDYFIKNAPKIIVTVKWQTFLAENPTESNELMVKLLVPGSSSSK